MLRARPRNNLMSDLQTATTPTSTAATRRTEPDIVAGISSGEGQPATYDFSLDQGVPLSNLMLVGGAAAVGFVASFALTRYLRR